MDKGLIAADSKVRPKAPGMKYRHYAPKADLAIVEGPEEAVVKKINELAAEAKAHGEQVGIIATDETKDRYPGRSGSQHRKSERGGNNRPSFI